MSRLVVTGTGTGVGKTIVTAAIAAVAAGHGRSVVVVKPVQTGVGPGEESDIDVIARLSRLAAVHELVRYSEPLAPATAARRQGVAATPVSELAQAIIDIGEPDLMLIEGAGGALVRLDDAGATVADLAGQIGADVLVVTTAGLGTLNAAALTGEALRRRGLTCTGAVIGDWPREPGLAELCNLDDLPDYLNAPLLGALPAGVGGFCPAEFLRVAQASLAPPLGGTWSV